MELHIYKDNEELSHAVAEWIVDHIVETLKKRDRFTWVLSGGNTPKALYELLAASPFREKIEWGKLHFFWGDERAVPFEDPRNNAKMAFDTLLNHVQVPASQIHIMRTDIPPEQSAAEYEKVLHRYFPTHHPPLTTFDLVLSLRRKREHHRPGEYEPTHRGQVPLRPVREYTQPEWSFR